MENKKEEKNETDSASQNIVFGNTKQIIDILLYEKWRDDGKYDHKKRDIEKKLKKANAAIKAKKGLNTNVNPSDKGQ